VKLPTTNQVRRLVAQLRDADLAALERRLVAALDRDVRTGSAVPDGYPSSTMGGGRGGSEDTAVERTVLAREGRLERDQVREDVEQACGYLVDAVAALGACDARLDHLDRISSPLSRSETSGAAHCEACQRWVSGSATDRIRSGYCDSCRKAWDRAGRPDRSVFARQRRAEGAA
jgi:hypothetical protein